MGKIRCSAAVRFWAALPIEAVLRHVRWSGEAGYILISQLADKTQPLENAISFLSAGKHRISRRTRRDGLLPLAENWRAGEAGFDLSLTGFDEFELGELFPERTQG
jgi:hypothetical protein